MPGCRLWRVIAYSGSAGRTQPLETTGGLAAPKLRTIRPPARQTLPDQNIPDINAIDTNGRKPSSLLCRIGLEIFDGPRIAVQKINQPGTRTVRQNYLKLPTTDVRLWLRCVKVIQSDFNAIQPERVAVYNAGFCTGSLLTWHAFVKLLRIYRQSHQCDE